MWHPHLTSGTQAAFRRIWGTCSAHWSPHKVHKKNISGTQAAHKRNTSGTQAAFRRSIWGTCSAHRSTQKVHKKNISGTQAEHKTCPSAFMESVLSAGHILVLMNNCADFAHRYTTVGPRGKPLMELEQCGEQS